MSQYALPLSLSPVFAEDNFAVSECNREAWQWIGAWPKWPARALYLYGPSGSGKTHLAHIWAAHSKAAAYDTIPAADAITSHWLLENIECFRDERALLHALNFSREHGHTLLFTSSVPQKQLPFKLPDLTSRLLALPAVSIAAPDDEALLAAMQKQFADRQLKVPQEVIDYLLPRMERSFAAISGMVERLDRASLSHQKKLTIPFLKDVLGY